MEKSVLQLKTSTSTSSLNAKFERSPEEFDGCCLICAESFDKEHLRCVVSCGHNDVCGVCFLRLRALQRNFSCPSCKADLEAVICVEKDTDRFTDFSIWGDSIGPDHMYDERSKIFFPKPYFKAKVESLFAYSCRIHSCRQTRRDMKSLRQHMLIDHKMNFCLLCIEHKQSFPAEQKVYTQVNYEIHLRDGDGDGGHGHPLCQFCRKRYYDKTDLFVHLSRDHFSCFLCERQGIQFKYFEDYKNLEDHFRTGHFICEDSLCLCKRFVVFANSIDLAAHVLSVHPFQQASRNIPIHFKVRRPTASGYERDREGGTAGSKSREEEEEEEFLRGGGSGNGSGSGRAGQSGGAGSSSAAFEGGMGGRVRGGEWQVELPPTVGDPRGAARSTGTKGGSDEEADGSAGAEANPFITMGRAPIDQCPEEYPALAKQGGGGPLTIGGWNSTLSQGSSSGRSDFPELPASARPAASSSGAVKSFMKVARGASISSKGVGGSSGVSSSGKSGGGVSERTVASMNTAMGGSSYAPGAAFGSSEPSPDAGRWAAHINVKKDKRLKNHFPMGKSASTSGGGGGGGDMQLPASPTLTEQDEWQSAAAVERASSTGGLSGFDVVDDLDAAAIAAAVASAEEELNNEEALAALTRSKIQAALAAGVAGRDTTTSGGGSKKKGSGAAKPTAAPSSSAAAMGWGGALKTAGVSSSQKKQPVKTGLSLAKPLVTAKSAAAGGGGLGPAATSITSVGSAGGTEMAGEGAATAAAALRSLDALKPMGRLHRDLEDSSHYLKTSSSTSSLNALLGAPPGLGLPAPPPPPTATVASSKRTGSSNDLVGSANQAIALDFPAFPLAPPSSNSNSNSNSRSNKPPAHGSGSNSSSSSNNADVGSSRGKGGSVGKSKMGWTKTGGSSEADVGGTTTASSSSSSHNITNTTNNNKSMDPQDYPVLGGGSGSVVAAAGGKGTPSSTRYAAAAAAADHPSKATKRGDVNGNSSNASAATPAVPKQPQHPAVGKKKRSELQDLCMIKK